MQKSRTVIAFRSPLFLSLSASFYLSFYENYPIFAILQKSIGGFFKYLYIIMSVIQNIRDKYARWAVIAIALALTGFILMDAFTGRSRLFSGGNSTSLGRVNGKTIDEAQFEKKVQAQEQSELQRRGGGGSLKEAERQAIISELWKQEVDQVLLQTEFGKLGLRVEKKERTDMLYGPEPQQLARQYLGNPQTGEYDPNQAQQIVNSIRRGKDNAQKEQLNLLLTAMDNARMLEKYTNLVAGTIHYPKWLLEKQNADNSLMARVSYVNIPASLVSDNAKEVVVTNKEIADYIEKHKDIYKTEDELRTIEYVLFSAAPNAKDTAATLQQIESLKEKFGATNDSAALKTFLASESSLPYGDSYFPESAIQVPAKDSILKISKGAIYGPYLDNDNYVLAKMIDHRILPDSVYCRHILMRTSGEGGLPDTVAEKRLDSAIAAINAGASFVTVMKQVSMDQAANSQDSLGIMKFSSQQIQEADRFDQDFGRYILFEGAKGQRKKVKTQFGYHYIEVVDQIKPEPHFKIAYLSKKIEASDETERNAENTSLQFAGESRDQKSFDANFEKMLKPKGYQKLYATDINSHAYEISGVGVSRKFIKQVFEADKGDVMQPERVSDNYVVAVVTEVNKPGKISVAMGRRFIEPMLLNQKKAAILKKRIGKITTLEAVSSAMGQLIQTADSVRFSGRGVNPIAFETKVIGATFNPANKGKVVPEAIEGIRGGVFVIRVDNVTSTPVENADVNLQRAYMETQGRMSIVSGNRFGNALPGSFGSQYDPAFVLRRAAKIKDYRNKFY
jgi:peptidyl-prolyl cis-trans isomerase D